MDTAYERRKAAIARYERWGVWYIVRQLPFLSHRAEAISVLARMAGTERLDDFLIRMAAGPVRGRLVKDVRERAIKETEWITFLPSNVDISPELDAYVDQRDLFGLTEQQVRLLQLASGRGCTFITIDKEVSDLVSDLRDRKRKLWVEYKKRSAK